MDEDKMMQILHEVFDPSLPRLAPGDDTSTRHALEMLYGSRLEGASQELRVLDIGCGNGAQTLRLAAELGGWVTAVDNHQPYLDELQRRAEVKGLADRIGTRYADMRELDLHGENFDLVWAEGSAFVMGIPEALQAWRSFLRPGGAVGFTELTWIEDGAPEECRDFFAAAYPQMTDVETHLQTIRTSGYEEVGWFILPESSWWKPFYEPLSKRLREYEAPSDDAETRAVLDLFRQEVEVYRRFSRWYGYVFFLLRIPSG
jgi:ubiquinone/menaquinone biosynthesis C-methylase UbiE